MANAKKKPYSRKLRDGSEVVAVTVYISIRANNNASKRAKDRGYPWSKASVLKETIEKDLEKP